MVYGDFFKITEGKIFLVLSILIANSISPFFDLRNIPLYIVIYYLISCIIVWGSETLVKRKKPGTLQSALESMKVMSLIAGAMSIAFGFVLLDFTLLPFLESGKMDLFGIFSGYLLVFIGIGMIALSKSFHIMEKSLIMKIFKHKKLDVNPDTPINLISALILAITMSLYAYKSLSFGPIFTYVILLLIITGSFVWFIFKIFK